MKTLVSLFSVLLLSSVAFAGDAPAAAAGKTHEVTAQVVKVDAAAKTITIKAEGGDKTVPCEGAALDSLKTVKAGDNVTLTCKDNDKGEHQACVGIKAASAAPAPAPAPAK